MRPTRTLNPRTFALFRGQPRRAHPNHSPMSLLKSTTILILAATLATACQVPVFRYALERWESDDYQLFLVTPKPLTPTQTQQVTEFQKKLNHTNLKLDILDTSRLTDAQLWKLPDIDTSATTAQLALYYPKSSKNKSPILTVPFTPENLATIIESPARRDIVKHIINGSSCVWILIHQGKADDAQKIQSQLNTHLRQAEKAITIPDGIIGTAERHKITGNTDLEDVLRSAIPLKISFTSLLIDRSDPAESPFIATLLANSPPAIRQGKETLIIPVFGRGRQLPPMPASRLGYQPILNGCKYLCGACSCQVKEQNPGFDLLIRENWPSHLITGLAVVDKQLPPLGGVGDITQTQQKSPIPEKSTPPPNQPKTSITRTIPIIIGTSIALLILLTIITLKRK